ncbi:sulfatase [Polaribacter staleyi]|uniref:sulfatase family protein n=1 Tax=Polaribacter staleyi TaxID=2022337 RepID=UPI0031BBBE68
MKQKNILGLLFLALMSMSPTVKGQGKRPNLIIIQTDEHNFRTLGCYRDQLRKEQAYVWGEGVEVKTPNIDRIANEGAICNNYYASSPVCTPSRASFVSGLYPVATASYKNDIPMYDDVVTFAEALRKEGYATSYLGKWHLDGDSKPGFAPKRKFGFDDNRYMFNRGHWKALGEKDGVLYLPGKFDEKKQAQFVNLKKIKEENFTTDFLVDRTLETLERDKDKPFCVMVSIPDPHGPNKVRSPYDTMFKDVFFKNPKTLNTPIADLPKWAQVKGKMVNELNQKQMQIYFGMVKCVDDNVGRILDFLDENNLTENTIVVFTSDHGDLMGEHHKHNKSVPYETSAKIPFVLRYPAKVKAGKVIKKAYTTADFSPTILGLMNASPNKKVHGIDASSDFTSKEKEVVDNRITYITAHNQAWVAALDNRYKLVISESDEPWLIDLEKDPNEQINYYSNPEYSKIVQKLTAELKSSLVKFKDPILKTSKELRY